ncbi:MAG TPA: hydroxylamine reductase [Candidatus Sulfotelmatobacter sp.]|nr:hydroxylamine reductase [Candidatus Sulfotelmatobacter sp.]
MSQEQMFCYQCEQTFQGKGCTIAGVCGKSPEVAALQDLLVYMLRGLSQVAVDAHKINIDDESVGIFTCEALFATLTNVNFDPDDIIRYIRKAEEARDNLKSKVTGAGGTVTHDNAVSLLLEKDKAGLVAQGKRVGIKSDSTIDPDLHSLQWLLTYALKGVAAYAYHAYRLGKKDAKIFHFMHEGLAASLNKSLNVNDFVGLALKCGEINIRAMEILDEGNTETFGHPEPTRVPLGVKQGKAVLVSGHDLADLEEIIKLTEGKGINIYSHGEMLPAHGYPKLNRYKHFYGHYGTAWYNQNREFAQFPGAILMTTNCLQRPTQSYAANIFTTGPVAYPGIPHVEAKDFSQVVNKALELPGFPSDIEGKYVLVGFGRNAVLNVAGKVIDSVKNGHIKHFILVGGCDGAKPGRSYYSEFVDKAPKDTIILTLACGKFKFFDKELGTIDDIPRLLDIGQCNDAYSAVKIALALADAFKVSVNDLPLSLVLSWYEQKAVAILLSLLYLGIRNIRIGPSLPAFITPNILKVLVDKFNIMPTTTVDADLKEIMK